MSRASLRLAAGGVLLVGSTGGASLVSSAAMAESAPSADPGSAGASAGSVSMAVEAFSPQASFAVTNTNDSGVGSLRAAITAANAAAGADTITFDPAVTGTITLTSGEIAITDSVTISGPGMGALEISGNDASRIFNVSGTADVTVAGLGLAHGNASNASAVYAGQTGSITFDRVDIHDNHATGGWGALYLRNTGAVTITNSKVRANTANNGNSVSAIYTRRNTTSVTISGTSVTGNVGTGSVLNLYSVGDISIVDSTVADNSTTNTNANSPTMFLYSSAGNVIFRNTTVSGNSAAGNRADRSLIFSIGPLKVQNSTITANTGMNAIRILSNSEIDQSTVTGNSGHELWLGSGISGATRTLTVSGSIISDSAADDFITTNAGVLTVNSNHSIIGGRGANVNLVDAGGTLTGVTDLGLGALADNGGPTRTMKPLPGSPAIDAGPNPVATFPGNQFDQRGAGYPRVSGGVVDIGAVEVQAAPTVTAITPPSGPLAGGTTITLNGTGFGPGMTVTIGGAACTNLVVVSTTEATCVTPPGAAAVAVDVVVTRDRSFTFPAGFTYIGDDPVTPTTAAAGDDPVTPVFTG